MRARVAALVKERRIPEADYRALLLSEFNVNSSTELSADEMQRLARHLSTLPLAKGSRSPAHAALPNRPHNFGEPSRAGLYRKLEAQLIEAGRSWEYVGGIARRMFKRERLEFCSPHELRKLVAALSYDAARRARAVV